MWQFEGLQYYAKMPCFPSRNNSAHTPSAPFSPVTTSPSNFDGVPAPDDKLMDAIVTDPRRGSTYWIDCHILDPTAPSNRRVQLASHANSQSQSSLLHSNRIAYQLGCKQRRHHE